MKRQFPIHVILIAGISLLFEQYWPKPGIKGSKALILKDLSKPAKQTASESRFGHETNACRFEGAEGDVGKKFCCGRRGKVDSRSILRGGLITKHVNALLLEKLIPSKFKGALEKVSSSRGTKPSPNCTGSFTSNHLPKSPYQTSVVLHRVKLNSSFDTSTRCVSKICLIKKNYQFDLEISVGLNYVPIPVARDTYTSTGVSAPCVIEQHTAPASANLEYRATPDSFCCGSGDGGLRASKFIDPADLEGAAAAIVTYLLRRTENSCR